MLLQDKPTARFCPVECVSLAAAAVHPHYTTANERARTIYQDSRPMSTVISDTEEQIPSIEKRKADRIAENHRRLVAFGVLETVFELEPAAKPKRARKPKSTAPAVPLRHCSRFTSSVNAKKMGTPVAKLILSPPPLPASKPPQSMREFVWEFLSKALKTQPPQLVEDITDVICRVLEEEGISTESLADGSVEWSESSWESVLSELRCKALFKGGLMETLAKRLRSLAAPSAAGLSVDRSLATGGGKANARQRSMA